MNEKTNIGPSAGGQPGPECTAKPHVCCGTGGSGVNMGPFTFSASKEWLSWSDATEKIERLCKEKQEIYAALQQSELEATKWRCETEALRKAYTKQTEEYANGDRIEQKYRRAVMEELEETKRKLADSQEAFRKYMVERDGDSQVWQRVATDRLQCLTALRIRHDEIEKKLAVAERDCKIYQGQLLNYSSPAEVKELRAKGICLDLVKNHIVAVYNNLCK